MGIAVYRSATVTPTIKTAAYSAGDVVGGLMTFDFGAGGAGGGLLLGIYINDDDNEKAAATLYIYNAAPTTIADDAAFASALAFADLKKQRYVKTIAATDYTSLGPGAYLHETKINHGIQFDRYLYVYFVCTATPTWTAATDLAFTLDVMLEN